jgi:signal transduction histidine kinase
MRQLKNYHFYKNFEVKILFFTLLATSLVYFSIYAESARFVLALGRVLLIFGIIFIIFKSFQKKSLLIDINFLIISVLILVNMYRRSNLYTQVESHPPYTFMITSITIMLFFVIYQLIQMREKLIQKSISLKFKEDLVKNKDIQRLLLHEIKRPLNSLNAAIQVISINNQSDFDDDLQNFKNLSNEAVKYLENISAFDEVNELFENPNLEIVSIKSLSSDLVTRWRGKVNILSDFSSIFLLGDKFLLDIAIGNLIENAMKFSNSNDITVNISHNNNYFLCDVVDRGLGVPDDEKDKIWDKFYRINGKKRNGKTGSGLGLSIVKEVASVHKGYAEVVSQFPSTIRLAIPIKLKKLNDD